MKKTILNTIKSNRFWLVAVFAIGAVAPAMAFPPAPHHLVYGMLRDAMGEPFAGQEARVFLESTNGVNLEGLVHSELGVGVNYQITIPMDAGVTTNLYKPTALRPYANFTMRVRVGNTDYVPMEMAGTFKSLGEPAEATRLDLTLGVDSDGDGIPDDWEDLVAAMFGDGRTRDDINRNTDLYGDGVTAWQHYIAGTYPWDPEDRVELNIKEFRDNQPVLEFAAISRRAYRIFVSEDFVNWRPVVFRLPAKDAREGRRNAFIADRYESRLEAVVELQDSGLQSLAEQGEEAMSRLIFRLEVQ